MYTNLGAWKLFDTEGYGGTRSFKHQLEAEAKRMGMMADELKDELTDMLKEYGERVTEDAQEYLSGSMVMKRSGELRDNQGYIVTDKDGIPYAKTVEPDAVDVNKPLQIKIVNTTPYADLIHQGHAPFDIVPVYKDALHYWDYVTEKEVFSLHSHIPGEAPRPFIKAAMQKNDKWINEEIGDRYDGVLKGISKARGRSATVHTRVNNP